LRVGPPTPIEAQGIDPDAFEVGADLYREMDAPEALIALP
jgi:hypothetical protein